MKMILENTDYVNMLCDMANERMVEPIDDPSIQVDFWDWAETIGIVDEFAALDDPFWGVAN